jgi:Spy/CpxP family protein refolding chaperone
MRRIGMDLLMMGLLFGTSSALGLGLAACAAENASSAPAAAATTAATASPEDEESEADLREHHRHHHHGGVTMFIAMSLDSLGVSPEQAAAIEKIQGDLFAKMEPAHVAEQNVLNVLADGIAAGKIDTAKVDAAIEGVKAASTGVHEATVESLNQLHAALTPEQRATLVDKVEAHWEVWKKANTEELKPGDAAHPEHLDRLAKDLNLAPDQVEKIRATFAEKMKNHPQKFDPTQVDAHIQEFGAAFKAATFDAKTLQRGPFVHQHLAVWGTRRMAHFYEAIDPLLTAEQRAKLSAQIKENAAAKSGVFDAEKHER